MSRLVSRLIVMGLAFGMLLLAAPASAQVSDGKCPDPLDLTDPDCPEPPKKEPATCSPGFWKNHLLEKSNLCTEIPGGELACEGLGCSGDTCTCAELVFFLSAEEGATESQRRTAQACLNEFFGVDLGMPDLCADDD
jgi:hypothetical protein